MKQFSGDNKALADAIRRQLDQLNDLMLEASRREIDIIAVDQKANKINHPIHIEEIKKVTTEVL
jgi:hypothetical protein